MKIHAGIYRQLAMQFMPTADSAEQSFWLPANRRKPPKIGTAFLTQFTLLLFLYLYLLSSSLFLLSAHNFPHPLFLIFL
jgi:hypothetical protein